MTDLSVVGEGELMFGFDDEVFIGRSDVNHAGSECFAMPNKLYLHSCLCVEDLIELRYMMGAKMLCNDDRDRKICRQFRKYSDQRLYAAKRLSYHDDPEMVRSLSMILVFHIRLV